MENYAKASEAFDVLIRENAAESVVLRYNHAIAGLRTGDLDCVRRELEFLKQMPSADSLSAELELEIAFHFARENHPDAESLLSAFLKEHPHHMRRGDARVALAEIYYRGAERVSVPMDKDGFRKRCREELIQVAGDPQTPRAAAQAAYLAIFLADAPNARDELKVIELGEAFVRERSESSLLADVRMKLGEVYLRRKDFANAEAQFASSAKLKQGSPEANQALYLAGQCASALLNPGSVDRALGYWEKLAQAGGALYWEARYQQATVKSRIGEEKEGVVLFDLILASSSNASAELKFSAKCGKADAMLALARRSGEAIDLPMTEYRELVSMADVTPYWRNQAIYKIAKAYEVQKENEKALEAFYSVLDLPGSVEAGEYFWLFKAGFDAARILEGKQIWRDTIALYERLGKLGGPRAEEAKTRARQIRLEKFIWE
jgi:outer membrane protein assembly factor BamD (BamD/ComL family)